MKMIKANRFCYQDLKNILYEALELLEEEYTLNTTFEQIGITQWGIYSVADVAEARLGIEISDNEINAVKIINDIYRLLKEKTQSLHSL